MTRRSARYNALATVAALAIILAVVCFAATMFAFYLQLI